MPAHARGLSRALHRGSTRVCVRVSVCGGSLSLVLARVPRSVARHTNLCVYRTTFSLWRAQNTPLLDIRELYS